MKKKVILVVLLILPIFLYIYFSLAKHNSLFLPVLTEKVNELPKGSTLNDSLVQLEGKISVVGFAGTNVIKKKESIFNLNQKINSKYKEFQDFQIVILAPEGEQEEIRRLITELSVTTNISGWKFVFASPEEIKGFFSSLKVKQQLSADMGSDYVFIIDKELNLRGRDGKTGSKDKQEYRDAYNTFSAAELHNEMTDDIKILLREYRLALKKNDKTAVKRKI
jgi:hypothetical protein